MIITRFTTGLIILLTILFLGCQQKPQQDVAKVSATVTASEKKGLSENSVLHSKTSPIQGQEPEKVRFYTSNKRFLGAQMSFSTNAGTSRGMLPWTDKGKYLPEVMVRNPGNMKAGYEITLTPVNSKTVRFAKLTRVTDAVYLLVASCYGVPKALANGSQEYGPDQIAFPAWFKPAVPKPPSPGFGCGDVHDLLTPYTKK